jgi:hypothetical protein
MSYEQRIGRLEATYDCSKRHNHERVSPAWLASLSDDDIEFMAGVAEQLKAGASLEDIPVRDRERIRAIEATHAAFLP